jgi:DNA polymerase
MARAQAGGGVSDIARLDVETYSAAGYVWNEAAQKWDGPKGAAKGKGLPVIGAAAYAEHPSTDILTVSYELPAWWRAAHPEHGPPGKRRWNPTHSLPYDLFAYLADGHPIEHHNAMFERLIWQHVLTERYGWPPLNPYQQRCSMATARVAQYPAALGNLSDVLKLKTRKDKEGKRLLDKFSMPRKPTAKDKRRRILPAWMPGADPADAADFAKLEAYCDTDIDAEGEASAAMPPMTADELNFWWVDQEINSRGMGVDRAGLNACIVILDQLLERYGEEHRQLTNGLDATQLEAVRGWLAGHGIHTASMDADSVTGLLARLPPHPPGGTWPPRRVLEIRQLTGSASVKKLYAMANQVCSDDRLRNLLNHHGARTGRPTGEGPQPLNLPRTGPKLVSCAACERPYRPTLDACPFCACADRKKDKAGGDVKQWTPAMVDHVLEVMALGSLDLVEWYFGDAALCISGCLRGLFVAAPGHELIASDYSAIEAVVIAMLAGEQWRIDAFRERKPIYLLSASKITGRTLEWYLEYAASHGEHHPDRQKIGKVAELGLGFGGWINAWLAFDDSGTFDESEIKRLIIAWRDASPAIVEFWGGQHRGRPWDRDRKAELYGVEGHAVWALQNPGQTTVFRGVAFETREMHTGRALIVRLPSGRELTYHNAHLTRSTRDNAEWAIVYWTWNSNPKYGAMGWGPMATFGGRLAENIVQAVAHDIMRYAVLNLRAAGYHTILHVYDEICAEIPIGCGSIEEFESIMMQRPPWAHDWPIVATDGWRGARYRKS